MAKLVSGVYGEALYEVAKGSGSSDDIYSEVQAVREILDANPDFGKLMPNDFIPIAEDSDVIVTISDWVLKTALEQNLSWKEKFGNRRFALTRMASLNRS